MNDTKIFSDKLRKCGLKKTPARILVLSVLANETRPVDVQSVMEKISSDGSRIDQATIYRILTTFAERGIVEQIDFRDGKYRYELQSEHHHHLVCEKCGIVDEIEGEILTFDEQKLSEKKNFLIKSHSLEFFGLCEKCQ